MSAGMGEIYDVIIVGAGPAGLSAAGRAQKNNLNYLVLEKGVVANTIDYYYQKYKYVMSQPMSIKRRSDIPFEAGSREQVLERWNDYVSKERLRIKSNEPVNAITKKDGHFEVKTPSSLYSSKKMVLAIGKLGNPRRVGAPGEDLRHLSDRLDDPTKYTDQDILVVGAGDAAAEVALALTERNRVSMAVRGPEIDRMNDTLRGQIEDKVKNKELTVYFNANVSLFEKGFTTLILSDRELRLKTDWVFIKIGAEVPKQFLERSGIAFSSKDISALPVRSDKYETNIPGLYLIGAVGGSDLIKSALNEGYEVIEHIIGHEVEPVNEPMLRDKLVALPGSTVNDKLDYISSRVPMLAGITRQMLREFVIQSDIRQVKKGEIIFKEGDYSTTFFCIVDGVVQALSEDSPEKEIFLRQGEFFGEISLLADRRRPTTIKTVDNSLLVETPRRTMLKFMKSEPSVKRVVDEAFILRTLQSSLSINIFNYEFREVATKLEVISFKKGDIICKEGEIADSFYVIRFGSAKISKKTKDGNEYVITYLPAGNYFGESALLSENNIRGATVSAATKTEAIRILSSDFRLLLNRHPELENRINREMGRRKVETSAILQVPSDSREGTGMIADFIKYGVVESTDVLIIDETKCIRCDNCVSACAATHGGQTRLNRRPGPSFGKIHVPIACRHCEGAPCLQDCPPGDAIVRDSAGVVRIDEDKCIGCGNCARFCPYGVIFMVEATKKANLLQGVWQEALAMADMLSGKKKEKIKRGIAVKCDLCHDIYGGPACVRSCPTGAAIRVKPDYFKKVEFV